MDNNAIGKEKTGVDPTPPFAKKRSRRREALQHKYDNLLETLAQGGELVYDSKLWNIDNADEFRGDDAASLPNLANSVLREVKWKPKPRSFTLFPKLPLELQRMIWKLCLPGSRVVQLTLELSKELSPLPSISELPIWCVSYCVRSIDRRRPTIASVCIESRKVFLEHYQTLPITKPEVKQVDRGPEGKYNIEARSLGYINPTLDVLLIAEEDIARFADRRIDPKSFIDAYFGIKLDISGVRRISIDILDLWTGRRRNILNKVALGRIFMFLASAFKSNPIFIRVIYLVLGASGRHGSQWVNGTKVHQRMPSDAIFENAYGNLFPNLTRAQRSKVIELRRGSAPLKSWISTQLASDGPFRKLQNKCLTKCIIRPMFLTSYNLNEDLKIFPEIHILSPKRGIDIGRTHSNTIFFMRKPRDKPTLTWYVDPEFHLDIPWRFGQGVVDETYVGIQEMFEGYPLKEAQNRLDLLKEILQQHLMADAIIETPA